MAGGGRLNFSMERGRVFSKIKRRILRHVLLLRILLVTLAGLVLFLVAFGIVNVVRNSALSGYIGLARQFLAPDAGGIAMSAGRTNILILGKGGEGHEAADLTDTIIFASVAFENPKVVLISLPRDIWIPALRAKLNSTYYWGNQKQPGGGLILAKSTVEEIVGVPVHYGVVLDFSGFKRAVDAMGGIEVNVERDFTDNFYPVAGREADECGGDPEFRCRYETVHFEKGLQMMTGEGALKFVRSRRAEGDEGGDLARSARQEKVLGAIFAKAISPSTFFSIGRMRQLVQVFQTMIETDVDSNGEAILARWILNARGNIVSNVVPEEFLVNPPVSPRYDRQYVFVPSEGNWKSFQKWVRDMIF